MMIIKGLAMILFFSLLNLMITVYLPFNLLFMSKLDDFRLDNGIWSTCTLLFFILCVLVLHVFILVLVSKNLINQVLY